MDEYLLKNLVKDIYGLVPDSIARLREGGSVTYVVAEAERRYLLKIVPPAFADTAARSAEIVLYLMEKNFPVPALHRTLRDEPCAPFGDAVCLLSDFIEGSDAKPGEALETLGALTGRLHMLMRDCPAELIEQDREYYIDRYVRILQRQGYARAGEFEELGERLWKSVDRLPRGFCHGDLYPGNLLRDKSGLFWFLDFDTACRGFPMHDVMCLCNGTEYFRFQREGYRKTAENLKRFFAGYEEWIPVGAQEKKGVFDLLAVYHFQLQATILEIHGPDCVNVDFFDQQLDWLKRWMRQCKENA